MILHLKRQEVSGDFLEPSLVLCSGAWSNSAGSLSFLWGVYEKAAGGLPSDRKIKVHSSSAKRRLQEEKR